MKSITCLNLIKLFNSPMLLWTGNIKGGNITVSLTSCLTGLDQSVLQIKTKIVSCHTANSKPIQQEVNGTVILPLLVFLLWIICNIFSLVEYSRFENIRMSQVQKLNEKRKSRYLLYFNRDHSMLSFYKNCSNFDLLENS